jgi:hypothetical protein
MSNPKRARSLFYLALFRIRKQPAESSEGELCDELPIVVFR